MDDLTAFVAARLDEDEAVAKAVEDNSSPWDGQWRGAGDYLQTYSGIVLAIAAGGGSDSAPGVIEHAARHDPARVLREVGAKRAIAGMHHPTRPHSEFGFTYPAAARFCGFCGPGDNWQAEQEPDFYPGAVWPCRHARLLAAVWDDHPDYRPEWKP